MSVVERTAREPAPGARRRAVPRQLVAFGLVGCAAAAVHVAVVAALVAGGIAPLAANVAAFLTAFTVSFFGHDRWTFPVPGRARAVALRRFFLVAAGGFVANETLYFVLLRSTALDYRVALVVVLAAVAALTLLASRHWAFANDR